MLRRLIATSAALMALSTATTFGGASAAASVSNGRISCTVTSQTAALSKTSLTAKASVTCTAATTAAVYIGLVEMDGSIEQAVQAPRLVNVAVLKAGTAYAVSGSTVTCPSTEVGNEEYASKVQVVLVTSTGAKVASSWDLRVPANDAHRC